MCSQAGPRIYLVGRERCRGSKDSTFHRHPASDGGTAAANVETDRQTDRHEVLMPLVESPSLVPQCNFYDIPENICLNLPPSSSPHSISRVVLVLQCLAAFAGDFISAPPH